ncbi:MAG: hypothetical protein Q9172_005879, partial [Xanthocarpia lactea]
MAASPTTEYYGNPYVRGIKVSLIPKGATAIPTLVRSIINIYNAKRKSNGPARQPLLIDIEISVDLEELYPQSLAPASHARVLPRRERCRIYIRFQRGKEMQVATGITEFLHLLREYAVLRKSAMEHELDIVKQDFNSLQE